MVKTFKEFIGESIWSDIQDRSSGDVIRKEDSINHLNIKELYKYITDNYTIKDDQYDDTLEMSSNYIHMVLYDAYNYQFEIDYYVDDREIVIYDMSEKKYSFQSTPKNSFSIPQSCWNLLNNKFNIKLKDVTELNSFVLELDRHVLYDYNVYPKYGSRVTNNFLIEFINTVIDNIPRNAKQVLYKK